VRDLDHRTVSSANCIMKMKFAFSSVTMPDAMQESRKAKILEMVVVLNAKGDAFQRSMRAVGRLRGRILCAVLCSSGVLLAAANGSLSGIVKDPSGAVVPEAKITLVNRALKSRFTAISNGEGFYSFPDLPVGHYDATIEAAGFTPDKKADLVIDTDAAIRLDATLTVAQQKEAITVEAGGTALEIQIDTVATHLGELVTAPQMSSLPLNGRSYTDLLPIQPGVTPVSTLLPNSVIMAGVTGGLDPSGDLNAGNLSIDGQRESSNGFMMNGIDVQEHMNGGTSVVANLDSIDEFRVLTNNFDPEYGNYNGGMVTVITKSGSDTFHGSTFEFLRNTALDARGYFDPTRPAFRQNQFGGTLGGPMIHQKIYFFSDYQGTRMAQGVETGLISVPSSQDRSGDLSDLASTLTGTVSGSSLAALLSQPQELGYAVYAGEPYYSPGCTIATCVFPGAVIPKRVWSKPAQNLLQYIPSPNVSSPNGGADQFATAAYLQTLRDDKFSWRIDANTRLGQISSYYFFDDYRLDNPYPEQQGGASIPGFDALNLGRAQFASLGEVKAFGSSTVNEFHAGFLRYANVIGQPRGGLGVTLAQQGFVTASDQPGFTVQAPHFEGVENIVFPSFVMGVPITNETQVNNTVYLSNVVSRVVRSHTLKFGVQFHADQVNEHPNATFNGTFNISGTETGSAFADFLIGVPSNFTQSSGEPFYLRKPLRRIVRSG
jgi:hypothetical protein